MDPRRSCPRFLGGWLVGCKARVCGKLLVAMTLNQHLLVSILSIVDIYIYYICIHISYIYIDTYTLLYMMYIYIILQGILIFTSRSCHCILTRIGSECSTTHDAIKLASSRLTIDKSSVFAGRFNRKTLVF